MRPAQASLRGVRDRVHFPVFGVPCAGRAAKRGARSESEKMTRCLLLILPDLGPSTLRASPTESFFFRTKKERREKKNEGQRYILDIVSTSPRDRISCSPSLRESSFISTSTSSFRRTRLSFAGSLSISAEIESDDREHHVIETNLGFERTSRYRTDEFGTTPHER